MSRCSWRCYFDSAQAAEGWAGTALWSLQAGDLVLHINGESTQGLTHAQVVEQIRTGGPRLHLMLSRPLETHPGKPKEIAAQILGDQR